MTILSFGEILFDIIEKKPHLGGAPLNFTAHAAQMGARTFVISSVGNDHYGQKAIEQIKALGVDTSLISTNSQYPTGTVDVVLSNGQPEYTINTRVAYDFIAPVAKEIISEKTVDAFYFGTLAQRSSQSKESLYQILEKNTFQHVFYDVNLRKDCYSISAVEQSLQYATIVKINEEEVYKVSLLLFGIKQSPQMFSSTCFKQWKTIKTIIITLGKDGCMVITRDNEFSIPGIACDVKDAIGAGDSFSAAFMVSLFKTGSAEKAAVVANQVGAFVASSNGALPQLPNHLKELF